MEQELHTFLPLSISIRMKFVSSTLLLLVTALGLKAQAPARVPITWVKGFDKDFKFASTWHYADHIYRNAYGQLSCDGLCPPETEAMKDSTGRIYTDSLQSFYALVDTSHHYRSIECEARYREWAGAEEVAVRTDSSGALVVATQMGIGTHCSFRLHILGDSCMASVYLLSIIPKNDELAWARSGFIRIDPALWKKGVLKAEFYFDFSRPGQKKQEAYFWSGRIYTALIR